MYKSQALRQYEETGLALRGNLEEKILAELSMNPDPDWGFLLSHYTNAFKQLDSYWMDMDPEFQSDLPCPAKVTAVATDIPQLLSTNIPVEDSSAIITPDLTAANTESEIAAIVLYNERLANITQNFSLKMEKAASTMSRSNRSSNKKLDNSQVLEKLKAIR
mmetsp:Transcript_4029/g.4120  ORF Transcript_4029/g.4120 Transcript_4029/m.4120 type:complete len:162 (+) Transcript_4029:261-746(+)